MHELIALNIDEFHDYILEKKYKDDLLYRKGYIQDMHTCLSGILKHGMKLFELKMNVASLTGNIKNDEETEWDYYTLNEFNYFDNIYDCAYFRLMFYSGLRKGISEH